MLALGCLDVSGWFALVFFIKETFKAVKPFKSIYYNRISILAELGKTSLIDSRPF